MIFKVCGREDWAKARAEGVFKGSAVDLADGYIHFSTATQLAGTLAKHFTKRDGLILAAVDEMRLGGALKFEPSRGGDLFPHLHAPLSMADVAWERLLPLAGGVHVIPEEAKP
jgi:uncharacterized protein (DUF952 family)